MRKSSKTFFVTLTYEKEPIKGVEKRDLQLFFKRFRKNSGYEIKYFAVGEYGSKTKRPHYHILLYFNCHIENQTLYKNVIKAWGMGNIHVGFMNEKTIMYTTKYHVTKTSYPEGKNRTFILASKGLGKKYINEKTLTFHQENVIEKSYYNYFDMKLPLPRYLKEKIYSKRQMRDIYENALAVCKDEEMILEMERRGVENPVAQIIAAIKNKNENYKEKSTQNEKL